MHSPKEASSVKSFAQLPLVNSLDNIGRSTGSGSPLASKTGTESRWGWCMHGKTSLPNLQSELSPERSQMLHSMSFPQTLGGTSMLVGNMGGAPTPFHGTYTRKFGITNGLDPRMRGGVMAREKWLGAFPEREARKCHHNCRA
eukprot:TRINITY_DN40198_c0_g1_i1.p1 TRINITY_DN40198_c0_g1~~TRINITY_DN40198_c0_g1_i1.p1  ORF type:complete len:158 (+),score=13.75 TRINITY_DN40198_c0_g1_i1:46-474(+)